MDTLLSKCLLCSLGCDVAFRVKGEAVVGPEFCETGGSHSARVCSRGLYGAELMTHPQRVANPLVRREGVLREASWSVAIDSLASALKSIVSTHGPEAVAVVTEPTRSTAELEAVGRLARSLGAGAVSCMFEPQDFPLVAHEESAGVAAVVEANCVIVLGDVFFSHAVIAKEIIDAKYTARGNSLFVVDPRRSNTAWYASEHVQNRPGTEALVLACILKALRASGKMAADAHAWIDSIDEKALLEAAGVGRDAVARMARTFADAGKAALIVAPAARGMHDVALVARLARLVAEASGEQKACVLLPSGGNVRGARQVAAKSDWKPFSTLMSELEAGKYRALLSFGADPLAAFPSPALSKAISDLDLVASVSLFRGEFEGASSVVLAGASWLETDGSAVLFDDSIAEWKSVGPPSWGTRTLSDVVALIEAAAGQTAARPGASRRDAASTVLDPSRSTLAARIEAVRAATAARAGDQLSLVALPAAGHAGAGAVTGWMQWAQDVFPGGFCELSVQDAAAQGIAENDSVTVESSTARLDLRAKVTDRLKPGVMAVPGYDPSARALFSWQVGEDGWFSTGPGSVRMCRKQ